MGVETKRIGTVFSLLPVQMMQTPPQVGWEANHAADHCAWLEIEGDFMWDSRLGADDTFIGLVADDCMGLEVWEYGEKSGFKAWKGLFWGMVSEKCHRDHCWDAYPATEISSFLASKQARKQAHPPSILSTDKNAPSVKVNKSGHNQQNLANRVCMSTFGIERESRLDICKRNVRGYDAFPRSHPYLVAAHMDALLYFGFCVSCCDQHLLQQDQRISLRKKNQSRLALVEIASRSKPG
ncbi:hypothetical protein KSP40_PGU018630 [Platanthera guangdongensis]|uniref:Uncharacterized protein n=1 Tax=Platanthera guangdongensis TaxID=2320717 RepID=A0ABR2M2X6_9ASPA